MSLIQRIDDDLKGALKSGRSVKVSALRMLKAAIKNKEIEKQTALTDEDIASLIGSAIKQRRDSIEQFSKGGRQDLADKETMEIEILQAYLPEQLSEEEIKNIISQAIKDVGATGIKDIGVVMKAVMPKVKGKTDGKTVNDLVKSLLEK